MGSWRHCRRQSSIESGAIQGKALGAQGFLMYLGIQLLTLCRKGRAGTGAILTLKLG